MLHVDIKSLLKRLNPICERDMSAAAGVCVSRTHYEVTIEHVIQQFVQDQVSDVPMILRHYEVEAAKLNRALNRCLEELKTGNAGKPVFSPMLLDWIQDAWLLSSVELGLTKVRSGTMFAALISNPGRSSLVDYTDALNHIPPDELRSQLLGIVAGSAEDEMMADEESLAPGVPGAAPGAPAGDSAIAKYMLDVTGEAKAGRIDPVLARDDEIRQMIDILARRRKNNPILVGEPGVGKTAIVEGLALRVIEGDVPESLKTVEIRTLDLGLLQAGAGMKGEFENRLKAVIKEVKEHPKPIITFIDEAHTIIGAGGPAGGGDAANLLKPALARGELRTIAATTWAEYKKYFEKDAALKRRFELVRVPEPSEEGAVVMLRGIRARYEEHHGVPILDTGVEAAVVLSNRYLSGQLLPDKAVALMDTAAARVAVGQDSPPSSVENVRRQIIHLDTEIAALNRDREVGETIDQQRLDEAQNQRADLLKEQQDIEAVWHAERDLVLRIRDLRKELHGDETDESPPSEEEQEEAPEKRAPETIKAELDKAIEELKASQAGDPLVHHNVDGQIMAQVVADWTGIPVGKMVKDELEAALGFEDRLRQRIVGQDPALSIIAHKIRSAKAGLRNPVQPIGVFLLVGPSGVGKTETALGVADLMFGGEDSMATLNMSEFMEQHTVSLLKGSPPGYVGYGEGGKLTEAVRQRPYSVVLLDEVEKAHPEVMNLFYQVFDKGTLADGEGREIDFKNTVVMLTSNLSSEDIVDLCNGEALPTPEELVEAIRPKLVQHFKPALVARMTVVPYYPIAADAMREIAILKLNQVRDRLMNAHKVAMDIDDNVLDTIAKRCTDIESGARNIDHILNQTIVPDLSREILTAMARAETMNNLKVTVSPEGDFVYTIS